MSVAEVNGARISFEAFGTGPVLVWSEGGRFGRNKLSHLFAGRFHESYSVLLWDRRNAGASDIALSDDPWYVMTDAEDLAALLRHLDLGPAHLAGSSAGTSASLLVAARYPDLVHSLLLLQPPTDDRSLAAPYAEAWQQLADVAEEHGMQAVFEASRDAWDRERQGETLSFHTWPAESIHANPANLDRLLDMDVAQFCLTMRRWSQYIQAMSWPPGLAETDLRALSCPTLIIPGRDAIHPRRMGRRLADLIPTSQIAELPGRPAGASPEARFCALFALIETFLQDL